MQPICPTQAAAGAGSGAVLQLNQGGSTGAGNQANQVRRLLASRMLDTALQLLHLAR